MDFFNSPNFSQLLPHRIPRDRSGGGSVLLDIYFKHHFLSTLKTVQSPSDLPISQSWFQGSLPLFSYRRYNTLHSIRQTTPQPGRKPWFPTLRKKGKRREESKAMTTERTRVECAWKWRGGGGMDGMILPLSSFLLRGIGATNPLSHVFPTTARAMSWRKWKTTPKVGEKAPPSSYLYLVVYSLAPTPKRQETRSTLNRISQFFCETIFWLECFPAIAA